MKNFLASLTIAVAVVGICTDLYIYTDPLHRPEPPQHWPPAVLMYVEAQPGRAAPGLTALCS